MSDLLNEAVAALSAKLGGQGFDGTAKFVMGDEGSFVIDDAGVRVGDDEADVTLSADVDVFQQIFDGSLDPTSAFMGGQLRIDGDMGAAMKLAQVLA